MDLCSEAMGTLRVLGLQYLFWWWFELWFSVVLRPWNTDCIHIHSLSTTLSILCRLRVRISDTSALFPQRSRPKRKSRVLMSKNVWLTYNKTHIHFSERVQESHNMLIPSFLWLDYIFIAERRYFSATELRQTFWKTWLCTAAFVLVIIAALHDESLISPNKSSFQDVKTRRQGRGCVFEVKSGWRSAGDDVHSWSCQTKYLLMLKYANHLFALMWRNCPDDSRRWQPGCGEVPSH